MHALPRLARLAGRVRRPGSLCLPARECGGSLDPTLSWLTCRSLHRLGPVNPPPLPSLHTIQRQPPVLLPTPSLARSHLLCKALTVGRNMCRIGFSLQTVGCISIFSIGKLSWPIIAWALPFPLVGFQKDFTREYFVALQKENDLLKKKERKSLANLPFFREHEEFAFIPRRSKTERKESTHRPS